MKLPLVDYAAMASDVYHGDHDPIQPLLMSFGWKRMKVDESHFPNGFYARFYHNSLHAHYVLSFRGTDVSAFGSLKADIEYARGVPPSIFQAGESAFRQFIATHHDGLARISLTGHSLGGILAKLLSVKTGVEAVAFNSPGIQSFVQDRARSYNIVNIDAVDDVVSKLGHQLGRIIKIKVDQGDVTCGPAAVLPPVLIDCLYQKHKMRNLLDAIYFNSKLVHMEV